VRPLQSRLVVTSSSDQPPPDELRLRWRRRPLLALGVRSFVVLAPLTASVVVGILASRQFRPEGVAEFVLWALWTAAASLLALWLVDVVVRRLLPLQRLLQLCLAFPDRAPSRLRVAVRAAVPRRPESLLKRADASESAAAVAEQVVTLLAALTLHDRRTRGHSERVCAFTNLLATEMHLSDEDRDRLTWVALVHDIGKLHVPSRLLNKPDKPTVSEWQLLKTHPERGAALTEPMREWLGPWADAVLEHHERYDGAGYPRGISGEEISLAARLIAVSDAFEVMTAPRAYRRPVDAQTARAELARYAGSQFDPEVVRHFLAIGLPQLRRAMGPLAWLAEIPFVSSWPRFEAAASTTAAHAATATAAAGAAGFLAIGSAGAGVSADTAHAASGDVVTSAAVPSVGSALPAQPVAAVHHQSAQPHLHAHQHPVARAHQHESITAKPTTTAHARPAALERPHRTHPATSDSSSTRQSNHCDGHEDGHEDGHDEHGHAYGHEHAPGWQKNWGPNGRHSGHHHHHGDDAV
jgi:hypothetical protein